MSSPMPVVASLADDRLFSTDADVVAAPRWRDLVRSALSELAGALVQGEAGEVGGRKQRPSVAAAGTASGDPC